MDSLEAAGEALTEAYAGWVSSCEIITTGAPTPFNKAEGNRRMCNRENAAHSAH